MKNLLLIFVRNPELGKVKTRLAATIGNEAALKIYKYLLSHTHSVTKNIKAEKAVYYADAIWRNDIWDEKIYKKKIQIGAGLGDRMQNAFADGFKNGFNKIVIIGSDILDVTPQNIATAFEKLENHEVVIGPAHDGGYYLLGLKNMIPELFQNKNWGSDSVLKDTLDDLKEKTIFQLPEYNDVDVFEDIENNRTFQKFLNREDRK